MKKKLIYIIPNLEVGGAEVALATAINMLSKEFNFRLICLGSVNPILLATLTEEDQRVIVQCKTGILKYVQAVFRVIAFKPEIVITSLWKAAIVGVIIKLFFMRSILYISFIHNSIFFHSLDKFFSKLAIRSANIVFCDSGSARDFIHKMYPNKKTSIISFLRFSSPNYPQLPKQMRLKALYIGRFHEQKRIDRLVLFVKKCRDTNIDFQVDLYGRDDGAMNTVKRVISQYALDSSVFIKGEISPSDIQSLLQNYSFYIQTSDVEGMAMSVVEAMQSGLVCIVTNVGEIRNYANNMINAIVIEAPFDDNLDVAVKELSELIHQPNKFFEVSHNAYIQFRRAQPYPISLTEAINSLF